MPSGSSNRRLLWLGLVLALALILVPVVEAQQNIVQGRAETSAPTIDTSGIPWPISLDTNGAIRAILLDGSGNQITSFGGSGGTSETDDGAFTAGSDLGTPMMGFYTTDAIDLGDVGVVRIDTNRRLEVVCSSGCSGGTTDDDDGDVAGSQSTGLQIGLGYVWDGDSWERMLGNDTDGVTVNLGSNNDVTVSGTVTIDTNGLATESTLADVETNTDFGTVTGGGTETGALRVTIANNSTGLVSVDDNGGALTVDGTITVGTFPDNEPFNVAQVGGTAVSTDNGTEDAGTQRVTIATDNVVSVDDNSGTLTVDGTVTATNTGNGSDAQVQFTACDNWAPFSTTTSAEIISGAAGDHIYICSVNVGPIGTATNVALVSGTGTVCGTSTAGIMGGATAATGWIFAANGGLTMGGGPNPIARTETTGDAVCLLLSAANQVSGVMNYAIR